MILSLVFEGKGFMSPLLELMGAAGLLVLLGFSVVSWREGERRACAVSVAFGLAIGTLYFLTASWLGPGGRSLGWGLILFPPVAGAVLWWPRPVGRRPERGFPRHRVDERDTMFSRRELVPGTSRYEEFYRNHPELEAVDEVWRCRPGLLAAGARYHHRLAFAAAEASFDTVDRLHGLVEDPRETGSVPPEHPDDPESLTRFLLAWTRKLGALDCGVTRLQAQHLYTVGGRRERYGRTIRPRHPFAMAFTVEMDHRMMRAAPDASTVMESAQQYLSAGAIAVQAALALRRLGYRARAHIDANYELICPLVARDAGLGEIGRMGLLMTPRLGPRVRIGVVTTDAPLIESAPREDPTVEEFCRICRKCAAVCPSQAIPWDDAREDDGVRRWRIDPAACFSYWCASGTDCGRCVIACPFAHPDHPYHNLVRRGIRRSPLFRHLALKMDDLFYGRKPRRGRLPSWLGPLS